jgi:hypothetical protein
MSIECIKTDRQDIHALCAKNTIYDSITRDPSTSLNADICLTHCEATIQRKGNVILLFDRAVVGINIKASYIRIRIKLLRSAYTDNLIAWMECGHTYSPLPLPSILPRRIMAGTPWRKTHNTHVIPCFPQRFKNTFVAKTLRFLLSRWATRPC